MKIVHMLAGLSALTLAAAPVVGQENATRAASPVAQSEGQLGESTSLIIFGAFAAAVVAALVIASNDDDGDEPASP